MKCLALVFLLSITSHPQIDSLAEALKYYPLQTGNYWEYNGASWDYSWPPFEYQAYSYSFEVVGDTILSNNKSYKILLRKNIPDNKQTERKYERIDTLTACLYRYTENTAFIDREYLVDSLLAKPGDYFRGSLAEFSSFGDTYRTLCTTEREDSVLGIIAFIKWFDDQSAIPFYGYRLIKDVGFLGGGACEGGCNEVGLAYAVINGVEYGKKITSVGRENSAQLDNYFLYQNYPNPFNPSTTISYQIQSSGIVTIKVYDLLGNEVSVLVNEEKQPGRYEIKFDTQQAGNLSSGVYFYRLQAGSFVQSRKLLLLK